MRKSIKDNPKKARGRPATGKAPLVGVRMHEEMQDLIKNWAAKQNDHPSLAAAIRRLVELGLKGKGEIMIKHARPAPVLNVFTVTIDGVTHRGTYYVQDSVVHVQCD